MRRLVCSALILLFACSPAVAGCGSSEAATTQSTAVEQAAQLYPVSVDGKWGYIDNTGTIRIQPQFDGADDFSDGLAMVCVIEDGVRKWGYIDPSGTLVIQPQFADAGRFSEGMAAVGTVSADDSRRYGYIDKTGTIVIPIQYEGEFQGSARYARKFSDGLCAVTVEGEPRTPVTSYVGTLLVDYYGYMDKTGSMVIEAQFDRARDFSEGLAAVSSGADSGFIDTSGNWVIKLPPGLMLWQTSIPADPSSVGSSCSFSEGLAIVWEMHYADVNKPPSDTNPPVRRCGYIDKTDKVVIEPSSTRPLSSMKASRPWASRKTRSPSGATSTRTGSGPLNLSSTASGTSQRVSLPSVSPRPTAAEASRTGTAPMSTGRARPSSRWSPVSLRTISPAA